MNRPPRKEVGPAGLHPGEAVPVNPDAIETQEEESMLLRCEPVTPAARKHFKLPRSPFTDDIQCRDDVFASHHGRYVRAGWTRGYRACATRART